MKGGEFSEGKNILVTGGCGFIGSNLVDELLKNPNHYVTVIDDLSVGTEDTIKHNYSNPHFKFIKADIRDAKKMESVCEDIDYIYHLAVQCVRTSIFNPELVHEVNATGTLNMLKAALKNNIEKFVYISSSEVYGTAMNVPMSEDHPTNPTTVYGASKLAGERYTKAFTTTYGLKTVIVRPFNTYGPREHFEGPYGEVIPKFSVRIKNRKQPLIFGNGGQTRDFTYVSDTVNGIILASNSKELDGQIINIARGEEVSVNEIANNLLVNLNSDLHPKYCEPRPGDVLRHYADISKAKRILNYFPKIDIRTGIKLYLDWLNNQKIDFSKELEFNWLKENKKVNIAVVGCGYWGSNLIRVFAQSGYAHLHTCCDMDDSKLNTIKSIYPYVNITSDYQSVLSNPEINAIVIATPVFSHYQLAKSALLADKHVLIEKPMASKSKEAKELIELAKQKNKMIMVDHTFEYEPAIRKIKEIIKSGELGEIYYIAANWLNLGILQPDVNVIFDLAPHIFSIINYITDKEAISIRAVGETYINTTNNLEEMANLIIKYPNNIIANINVSWLEPCKTRRMVLVGSKKMLVFDLLASEQIKIFDKGVDVNILENKISYRSGDVYSPGINFKEPLQEMVNHFACCITENKKPLTSGEEGLLVVSLLEAASQSLINYGGEIKLSVEMLNSEKM